MSDLSIAEILRWKLLRRTGLAHARGSAAGRRMDSWLAEVQRARRIDIGMSQSPAIDPMPTVTTSKSTGIASATVASGGSGYIVGELITLTGGTEVVPAIVRVTTVSGGAVTAASVSRTGVYTTAPTNPASQASSTGSGTGATFNLTANAGVASSISGYAEQTCATKPYLWINTGPTPITSGYYGQAIGNSLSQSVEWCTDAPQLDLQLVGGNARYGLWVDGQRAVADQISTDASGNPYLCTVSWSGVRKPRRYKLAGYNFGFRGILIDSESAFWAPLALKRPFLLQIGDSYTAGTGSSGVPTAEFWTLADALGVDGVPHGVGSTGWNSTSTNAPAARVAAVVPYLTRSPDIVTLALGYNDAGGNMTTLAASVDATIAALRAAVPSAFIIIIGPATPVGDTANLLLVRTALLGRAAANGVPFVDVQGWVTAANKSLHTAGDNVHPTPTGHIYRGLRLAEAISAVI